MLDTEVPGINNPLKQQSGAVPCWFPLCPHQSTLRVVSKGQGLHSRRGLSSVSRSAQGMASRAVTRKMWCCLGKAAELLKGGSAESQNLGPWFRLQSQAHTTGSFLHYCHLWTTSTAHSMLSMLTQAGLQHNASGRLQLSGRFDVCRCQRAACATGSPSLLPVCSMARESIKPMYNEVSGRLQLGCCCCHSHVLPSRAVSVRPPESVLV